MREVLRIELPKPLPSWNRFYAGMDHRARTRLKNEWRDLVGLVLLLEEYSDWKHPDPKDYPLVLEVVNYKRRYHLDCSNICVKLVEDGLVQSGVIPDDSPKYIGEVRAMSEKRDTEGVMVRLLAEG